MQITDLYQTKITCSTYNANIDSTDTVITVKLIDFNGNAVTGKSVTLTCDKGYFNKNGSTTISGTTTKSITATTNSSGEITGTWTASEWGLCTFSTNTHNSQILVQGWKTVQSFTGFATTITRADLQVNGNRARLIVNANGVSTTANTIKTLFTFNNAYASPLMHYSDYHSSVPGGHVYVQGNAFNIFSPLTSNNLFVVVEWSF